MEANDVPFTVREAAEFFRVEITTVWSWVRRYRLKPVGRREFERGKPKLYRFGDLAHVEQAVRSSGRGRPPRKLNPEKFA